MSQYDRERDLKEAFNDGREEEAELKYEEPVNTEPHLYPDPEKKASQDVHSHRDTKPTELQEVVSSSPTASTLSSDEELKKSKPATAPWHHRINPLRMGKMPLSRKSGQSRENTLQAF